MMNRKSTSGLATVIVLAGLSSGRSQAEPVPVGESVQALVEASWAEDDRLFGAGGRDRGDRIGEVTTREDASGGCDGVKNGRFGFHVASGETDPWWQVDLGRDRLLDRVVVFNRTDGGTAHRTRRLRLLVATAGDTERFEEIYRHDGTVFGGVEGGEPLVVDLRERDVTARVLRLVVPGKCSLALDEIEVYPVDEPTENVARGRPADQKSVSPYSAPGTPGANRAEDLARTAGVRFTLAHTGKVLESARRLAARLHAVAGARRLAPLEEELGTLGRDLDSLEAGEAPAESVRRELYFRARRMARRIAFANPLLALDRLLFIKRHDAGGVYHMCDQYYGCNAVPGGGIYVLEDPLGPEPRLVDLLRCSVVENGRLQGKKLTGGAFLSPELSWDGQTILFAYSEARARKTYQWAPEFSYHIFCVNADGTGLRQLTDGPVDDFDPCFLPGGRIAFISERRGGYLRCGRHCPVYTLHSMEPDGSDIVRLSYHETHEWHPSVANDGMLVYTRWDYVDRDTNIAHHIWSSYPDGRDPRSFHGNYPVRRESRPWMEMSIRAIPDSPRFVATAAAHHGHAFGSLVIIDPRVEDDRAMSQLERLTPEVPFPEAEGAKSSIRQHQVYATPWPLGEDDYLCVHDRNARNHGVVWIDRDGNRELIYRDPSIPCLSPIPLRPRPRPPVIPGQTTQTAAARAIPGADRTARIAVLNVYESDFEWPPATRIEALRIIQLLPKTTPPPNEPRIGVAEQTNARAVLGTVPVEADGSAYFEAPPGKAIYFQALDSRGLAVQSMRSVTYVHPGELLTCQGCHERKHRAAPAKTVPPLAMRRAPSPITPEAEGSNPFNFVRLVQPVLDRHCVDCHREEDAMELGGEIDGQHGWTRSYTNLAEKYGFYFHVFNGAIDTGTHGGSRTEPGKFGARASPLLNYLDASHHGVRLPDGDLRRITLWLDANSEFYGAYENTGAQARGEIVKPSLE